MPSSITPVWGNALNRNGESSVGELHSHKGRVQHLTFGSTPRPGTVGSEDVFESHAGDQRQNSSADNRVLIQKGPVYHSSAVIQSDAPSNPRLKQQLLERLGVMKL